MSGGSAIRGARVGAWASNETSRGDVVARQSISYFCSNLHETIPVFAADAEIPDEWECRRCGLPANQDRMNPPEPPKIKPFKSHLDYAKERRSADDAQVILAAALQSLKDRRAGGEAIY